MLSGGGASIQQSFDNHCNNVIYEENLFEAHLSQKGLALESCAY